MEYAAQPLGLLTGVNHLGKLRAVFFVLGWKYFYIIYLYIFSENRKDKNRVR